MRVGRSCELCLPHLHVFSFVVVCVFFFFGGRGLSVVFFPRFCHCSSALFLSVCAVFSFVFPFRMGFSFVEVYVLMCGCLFSPYMRHVCMFSCASLVKFVLCHVSRVLDIPVCAYMCVFARGFVLVSFSPPLSLFLSCVCVCVCMRAWTWGCDYPQLRERARTHTQTDRSI